MKIVTIMKIATIMTFPTVSSSPFFNHSENRYNLSKSLQFASIPFLPILKIATIMKIALVNTQNCFERTKHLMGRAHTGYQYMLCCIVSTLVCLSELYHNISAL